jgi:hypothetical protein
MTKDELQKAPNFEPYKEPATTGTTNTAPRPGGTGGGMNR